MRDLIKPLVLVTSPECYCLVWGNWKCKETLKIPMALRDIASEAGLPVKTQQIAIRDQEFPVDETWRRELAAEASTRPSLSGSVMGMLYEEGYGMESKWEVKTYGRSWGSFGGVQREDPHRTQVHLPTISEQMGRACLTSIQWISGGANTNSLLLKLR